MHVGTVLVAVRPRARSFGPLTVVAIVLCLLGLGWSPSHAASPPSHAASPASLSVSVRSAGAAVQVVLSASVPLRFSLRQLAAPARLVVDLAGLQVESLPGAQEVVLPPVHALRVARGSGFIQVVVDLATPVLVDVGAGDDGRTLVLALRAASPPAARAVPAVALPTEVVRLQHVRAKELAAHLQVLLPGLRARPDEGTNSVLLTGAPDAIAQAKQLIAALDAGPADTPLTEVVALKTAKAEVLGPVLAAIFPHARLHWDVRLNALGITAPPALLARVKAAVASLDVPPPAPTTTPATEVLRLQHADPAQAASLLVAVVPQVQVRVDPATRTLTVSGPPASLAQAKTLMQQFDLPSPSAPLSEIIRVRTADPDALAAALRLAVPGLTVTAERTLGAVVLQGARADVERAKTILTALDTQTAPAPAQMRVEVVPLRYAMPSEFATEPATSRSAEELAQAVLTALQGIYPEIRITVEKRTQTLIVTGTAPAVAAARDLIGRLDQPSPQVALEVRVVEVAATALQNLGVSLSPIVGTTATETDPNNRPFVFGRTPLNITLILNLLVEQGKAKILANPTVATIDGRKALIRTGDDIPLVTRQIFGNTVIENVITFRAGVTLEIIPKISPDDLITAILHPIVSTITGTTPQGAPQISSREVLTTLMVRSGETIVIGGLLEERDIISMSKIPGLGDLPFLGRLFRSERQEHRRTELVITVTPRVLPPAAPAPAR
jgi:type II secretory pathway component GspD/PulD (secretin)